jgi:hypothetical protein
MNLSYSTIFGLMCFNVYEIDVETQIMSIQQYIISMLYQNLH